MVPNLAIIGPSRSGKDTLAEYLVKNYGYTRLAFADPLKEEIVAALSFLDGEGVWSLERLERDKQQLRPLLQVWGTEFRRAYDREYWNHKMKAGLNRLSGKPVVVPDARFYNEIRLLRRHGFLVIRIVPDWDVPITSHRSDTELLDYPEDVRFCVSYGSPESLFEQVDRLLQRLAGGYDA